MLSKEEILIFDRTQQPPKNLEFEVTQQTQNFCFD